MDDGVDPREFQYHERENWDSVAAGWRHWWSAFEAGAQSLNERLVELAGIAPGHRCLDLATGIGEPALTAARVAGTDGSVLATDLSPNMLALGRERVASAGVEHVEFAEMNAEELDVDAGSFDAATCRWGLMLMLRRVLVAQNVRAALRVGGRFAVCVWGAAEEVPFIALGPRVIRSVLGVAPADPEEPGPFRLADPDELRGVLAEGGFSDIEVEDRRVTLTFAGPADYVRFVCDLSSTFRKCIAPLQEEERGRVLGELEAAAAAFRVEDGTVRFDNRVLCAVGTVS